jgi:serine/threonine-protein kinase
VAESGLPESLGKYEVQSVLGRGAMGIVYRAYDPVIERVVAIKVMHEHLCKGNEGNEGNDFAQRFQQEARAAARCPHPNIVAVFDFGIENDVPYLVMELVEGRELRDLLSTQQFSIRESIDLVVPVLSALQYAHSMGVVHRDIKPANIIVLTNGGVKVADFGVARLDTSDLTRVGYVVGTPGYMSPEGARGDVVDSRSDIYSTAMVLLQLITGQRPNPGYQREENIPELMAAAELSGEQIPELISILETALHQSPEQRFQSARQFQNALTDWLTGTADAGNARATRGAPAAPGQGDDEQSVSESISPELLKLIEQRLASYVGPMAGLFVRKACRPAADLASITTELASRIPNRDERNQFVRALENSDVYSSTLRGTQPAVRTPGAESGIGATNGKPQALDLTPEQIGRIITELTYFVGPVASRLVHLASARAATLANLYEDLAAHIPSEQDRRQFLQRTGSVSPDS